MNFKKKLKKKEYVLEALREKEHVTYYGKA